jgi:hypothetical protein
MGGMRRNGVWLHGGVNSRGVMELWSVVEGGTKNRRGGRWSEVRTQFVLQHKIWSIRNCMVHMVLYVGRTAKKQRAQKVQV